MAESPTPLEAGCSQGVEEQWVNGVRSDYVTESWVCDMDPKDKDFTFRFWLWWYGNPDSIKWYSTHWWIRLVFRSFYNGVLVGDSLCGVPKWLCIGTTGVYPAGLGSPSFVRDRLYLGHL